MSGYVRGLALAARAAQSAIAMADSTTRRDLIEAMAMHLQAGQATILAANAEDMRRAAASGASKATLDRLLLDAPRVQGMADALREVAAQSDPLGEVTRSDVRPNGIRIERYAHSIETMRSSVLGSLPDAVAARVAFKNAWKLATGADWED